MDNRLGSIIQGRETYTIDKDMTVLEAARYMAEKRVGAVPVLSANRLVGVFSERDLMVRVVVAGLTASSTYVSEVMTREVAVGRPGESYEEGMRRMQQAKCRHLPICDGDRLLGFISLRDLLQVEIDEKLEEIKIMNEYIHSTPSGSGV